MNDLPTDAREPGRDAGADPLDDGRLLDGSQTDGHIDDAGCVSFSSLFDTCGVVFDGTIDTSTDHIYDTDSHVLTDGTGGNPITVVARSKFPTATGFMEVWRMASGFSLNGHMLRVKGSLPFAIASDGALAIDGIIDLAAGGAGARTQCTNGAMNGANDVGGASGGGGGGMAGQGGQGGTGNQDASGGGAGGAAIAMPGSPLGGCIGGNGGLGTSSGMAAGGAGGGAMYLVAKTTLDITGAISVGGGGGAGGAHLDGGGGGGGSGGMILLEAAAVTLRAGSNLAANGGGGGGGYSGSGSTAAESGHTASFSSVPAAGGMSQTINGTQGGAGGAGTSRNGAGVLLSGTGAGGGGGGATGFILGKNVTLNAGSVSPALSVWP